ncbi:hypothetical protein [Tsukamurella tyrosinosolvens]|uniref:hypothetical protein n=1 Tax=Tsukamurella tyrosinosolvens TaxID=57704 RepID=UPI001146FEBE|nr:hypothetical protein [Tsukamurella tyrosinosolvens]
MHGNEFRSKNISARAIERLLYTYQNATDIKESDGKDDAFATRFLTQLSYEQFPYQESMFEEVARSQACLIDGLDNVETHVIDHESLAEMFDGVPLGDAINATFFLQAGVRSNAGQFNPSWLDQRNMEDVLKEIPRPNIEKVVARLITTPERFRSEYRANSSGKPNLERYDYNPLVSTPFVDMGDHVPVAPALRLILRTITPGGLYYPGVSRYGQNFASDLGLLFEHYIGRQLRLIDGAEVVPEIVFKERCGERRSVDWFVILPTIVLLVEVKSTRLRRSAQAGEDVLASLDSSLNKAKIQLQKTLGYLSERHSAFRTIPTDRPILAMIVTAEPIYPAAAYFLDHNTSPLGDESLPETHLCVASARDIEGLVTHGADVEGVLLEQIKNSPAPFVGLQAIGRQPGTENAILSEAWEKLPLLRRVAIDSN